MVHKLTILLTVTRTVNGLNSIPLSLVSAELSGSNYAVLGVDSGSGAAYTYPGNITTGNHIYASITLEPAARQ